MRSPRASAARSAPVLFGSLAVRAPLASAHQRIGLMGGSFNPPHLGHLEISLIALARLRLDRVWWIVSPGNPLKERGNLPDVATRIAMARALARDPRIVPTGFEAALPTPFTAATLAHVRLRQPRTHFVWLMGADNLAGFHRWRWWRDIFGLMPIAVLDRPGWRLPALASPAARAFAAARLPEQRAATLATSRAPAWCFLTGPLCPLSSTLLRSRGLADAGETHR